MSLSMCVCVFVCSRIILTFTWISLKIFGELNNKIDNVMSHRINVVIDLDKTFFFMLKTFADMEI